MAEQRGGVAIHSTPVLAELRTFPDEPPGFDAPPLPFRLASDRTPIPISASQRHAPEAHAPRGVQGIEVVEPEVDTLIRAVAPPPLVLHPPQHIVPTTPHPRQRPAPVQSPTPGLLVALGVMSTAFAVAFLWQLSGL